jgi:hypothetical protein
VISLLLFVSMTLGLIQLGDVSLRTVSILALIILGCFKIKSTYSYYINTSLVIIFLLFYSYLYMIDVFKFNNVFLLHTRNLIVFIVFFGVLSQKTLDFERLLRFTSLFIIICSVVNILIVIFFDKPWIIISLYTGTEEDNFGHLYNRLILPFGTPNQLGFVAGLLILYNIAIKNRIISLFLFIPLLGAASNSSIIPLTLILFGFLFVKLIKDKNIQIKANTILVCVFLISLLTIFLLFFYGFTTDGLGGRSAENMNESFERHILLRLNTLYALSDFSFLEYFYGVGFGNSSGIIEGSYSFTVPLTILFESGFFGLYVYYILLFMFIFKYKESPFVRLIIFYLFIASLLYQLNNDVSFYLLPLVISYQLHRKHNENNISL